MEEYDVAVLGAGAAGLAAAADLAQSGHSVAVIEARDRVGGRVLTRFDPRTSHPMELGAEFIHGEAPVTLQLLRAIGAGPVGEGGSNWELRDGRLQSSSGDPFDAAAQLMQQVDLNGPDESVSAFLARFENDPRFTEPAEWLRMVVEGFDAADPAKAGIQGIAAEWTGEAGIDRVQGRPSCGYAPLMNALGASLEPSRARISLQTIVEDVVWGEAGVRIRARKHDRAIEFQARRAVMTFPIGVLASRTVKFSPDLPRIYCDALAKIAMGPVTKVVLRFSRPVWEAAHDHKLRDAAFFYDPAGAFPAYWTTYPIVSPIVAAWAGGPRSDLLSGETPSAIFRIAVEGFARMLGIAENRLYAELEGAYMHDWQSDPYALGAYSYLLTGGLDAHETLQRPVGDVLYFAGEAIVGKGESGTVGGALESGKRAAAAIRRN